MFHQDWTPIVLHGKSYPPTQKKKTVVEIHTTPKKLNENLEDFNHKKIPKHIADAIQKKRMELKMTQAQVAQKINEKVSIVNDIENCSCVYNHVHVNKILHILGLSLKQISGSKQ